LLKQFGELGDHLMCFVPLLHICPVDAVILLRSRLEIHPVSALPSRHQDASRSAAVYLADHLQRCYTFGIHVIIGVKANIQNCNVEPGDPQRISNLFQVLAYDDFRSASSSRSSRERENP
jgi:hypothetical protein